MRPCSNRSDQSLECRQRKETGVDDKRYVVDRWEELPTVRIIGVKRRLYWRYYRSNDVAPELISRVTKL